MIILEILVYCNLCYCITINEKNLLDVNTFSLEQLNLRKKEYDSRVLFIEKMKKTAEDEILGLWIESMRANESYKRSLANMNRNAKSLLITVLIEPIIKKYHTKHIELEKKMTLFYEYHKKLCEYQTIIKNEALIVREEMDQLLVDIDSLLIIQ